MLRLAIIISHPIPHFAPWHREVARLGEVVPRGDTFEISEISEGLLKLLEISHGKA